MSKPKKKARYSRFITVAGFLGPFLVLLVVFRLIPIAEVVLTSLQQFNLLRPDDRTFIGADNFVRLASDYRFLKSMRVSATFVIGMLVLQIPLALALAMALRGSQRGIRRIRTIVFSPVTMSIVVVTAIWRLLLDPANGIFNGVLERLGFEGLDFITSTSQALPSLMLMIIWYQIGFTMILFVAGLQAIPTVYAEAAAVDGAGPWQRFRFVTLPLLSRTTVFVVVIITIFSFQQFAPAYVMTRGGPSDSTLFVVYYLYQQAFSFLDPGYASAIAVVFLATVLVVSLLQRRLLSRTDA